MPHHRLIILGAGTAGLSAWKQASALTDDILMIDPGPLGTTCARVGCMPSKALLQVALDHHSANGLRRAGLVGGPAAELDGAAVMRHVRELRDRFAAGPVRAVEKMGDGFIRGAARFIASDCVEVDGTRYRADAIIVAVGTQPFVPDDWRKIGDRLLTSDDLFEMPDIPKRVGVIGAGAIGCEIGQGLAMLGSDVHLFGRDQRLAGIADADINDVMHSALNEQLHLQLGSDARPERTPNGVAIRSGEQTVEVDVLVAAIGRRPPIEALGFERLDVATDGNGLPRIDPESLRAGDAPIWFAGDINGIRPIMHEAADEGRLAAWHAMHPEAECMARRTPMGIVFTQPQVAWTGLRNGELPEGTLTGECDFSRQGRSILKGHAHGLMKVHADASGRLIGAEMACAGAEHMAHELAWLIQQRTDVINALTLPFYHPVLEEGLRTALHAIRRQLPKRSRRPDLPLCQSGDDVLPGT